MTSRRTEAFKKLLSALPLSIQRQAREAYRTWKRDPNHPGLHFKKIHNKDEIWSARITENYRAVGVKNDDRMVWFWIGKHSEYERLLKTWNAK